MKKEGKNFIKTEESLNRKKENDSRKRKKMTNNKKKNRKKYEMMKCRIGQKKKEKKASLGRIESLRKNQK